MVLLIPGAVAPAGAPVISSANLLPASEPVGAVRTLLASLTGSYSDLDIAVIRQAYSMLERSGAWAKLDVFCAGLNNNTDTLNNWKGGTDSTRTGGSFQAGGIQLDGTDDYIDPAFDISGSANYKQDDCSFGLYMKRGEILAGSTFYGVGRLAAGDPSSFIAPRSAANTAGVRVNSSTTLTVEYSGPLEGFWHAQRTTSTDTYLYHDSTLLLQTDSAASVGLPSSTNRPVIGRTANFYYNMFVTGWYSGDSMSFPQRSSIQSALELLTSHFARDS